MKNRLRTIAIAAAIFGMIVITPKPAHALGYYGDCQYPGYQIHYSWSWSSLSFYADGGRGCSYRQNEE